MTHSYSIAGMTCNGCVATVKSRLEQHPDITAADVSLQEHSARISMARHISTGELQELIGKESKYRISTQVSAIQKDDTSERNGLSAYKPLILIFLFILGVSVITALRDGQFIVMEAMNAFMAGFFIVFAFFKFLDLRGFAESYAMYDLLAKNVFAYGFMYPFLELGLGIAYLTHFAPTFTYISTIVIMGFSSIGVIQSVLDKRKIKCACLGAVFELPMSTVTIIEDLLMVFMAALMLMVF